MCEDSRMNGTGFKWKGRWLCAVLVVVLAGTVLSAQSNAPAPNPKAEPNEATLDPNQAQVDFSNGCLIKFIAFQKEMTIRDGLRLLAALCKKNIVPSSKVEGPLTISRLYNVTFEQALEAVLGNDYKYEQDGDFVRVYTAEELKKIKENPERMIHKVITLYYITAAEAMKLVQPVLSDAGKIQASMAAQKTISTGTGSGSGSSGGGGSSSTGSSGLTSSGGGDDTAMNDTLVVFDYPENIEKVEAVVRDIDVRPKQVLVEATIMSATLDESTTFGIDWNLLSGLPVDSSVITKGNGYGTPMQTSGFAATAGGKGLTVGFSAGDARAVITAIETVADVTILANPKILAVNKQEGSILIGNKAGYRSSQSYTSSAVPIEGEVDFLQTGTQLTFRPYIGDNGYIRMLIYPKDSGGGVDTVTGLPSEDTTELTTNVVLKDGQTLIIGGLFRDRTETHRNQVPLLGDLPLVGVLFRGTSDTTKRQELIVMLTPHIIDDPGQTNAQDRIDDLRLKREGAIKELQAIDVAKIAEDAYARAAKYYLEGDMEKALFNVKVALLMRPTYLEALRLRERIVADTDPEQYKKFDSVAEAKIDEQEAADWRRF
jgi:type IV pilus assembly protein PilQ